MSFRYRFKDEDLKEFSDHEGFATRDAAVQFAIKATRPPKPTPTCQLYVYDTGSFPHRIVGLAEDGAWRHPVATCKKCAGTGTIKPNYTSCYDCNCLGVILEKSKWKA